ncbi:HAAS signaling domain-containing protein [Paenibacillus methanolicus]|uniref:Uncharacterized protein n=1 Tax=Paenibacillus methanolicus TaxID=582686 RepID=A0A5S5C1G9_9BACL|nr:hypothetical protein [Paenibacillus methanolicus]TYP73019.1 hypothetical protein BCM02_1073 [Paenibacillus methanolicus]
MELISRYIYAVTQKLPEKQRAEIEKELRGLIEDMLEVRTHGGSPSPKEVEDVLAELGNPSEMADRYRGSKRYLIGPGLFASYITVLRIVWTAIGIALGVMFMIESFMDPTNILDHFIDGIVSIVIGLMQGFAWVTVVFGVIEYTGAQKAKGKNAEQVWKPSDLPQLPDNKSRISPAEPIASIIFSVLFVVLFSYSIDLLGVWRFAGGDRMVIPFFNTDVFNRFLPYIWFFLAVSILKEIMKLNTRRWTTRLVGMEISVTILYLILATFMFWDPVIWNADFMQQAVDSGLVTAGSEGYNTVNTIWGRATNGIIYLIGLVSVIQVISLIVTAYRHKS